MKHKLNAYLVYLIMSSVTGILNQMIFTVYMVYQVLVVGLNPFQLVLMGTALEISVLLFEVPTGVIADVRSRRLSVIIGMFIMGGSFVAMGIFRTFLPLLLSQVVWGFGWTFISGAKDAWIADELPERDMSKVYLRSNQLNNIGGLVGIGCAILLALIAIELPLLIGGSAF